jgi:hypothetical protein
MRSQDIKNQFRERRSHCGRPRLGKQGISVIDWRTQHNLQAVCANHWLAVSARAGIYCYRVVARASRTPGCKRTTAFSCEHNCSMSGWFRTCNVRHGALRVIGVARSKAEPLRIFHAAARFLCVVISPFGRMIALCLFVIGMRVKRMRRRYSYTYRLSLFWNMVAYPKRSTTNCSEQSPRTWCSWPTERGSQYSWP